MSYLLVPSYVAYVDADGNPLSGGLLNVYAATTTTPINTYTTSALSVANANPIEADSAGVFPAAYIDDGTTFKLVLTDSTAATTIFTLDNLSSPAALSATSIPRTYVSKAADYTVVAADNGKFIDFDASGADRVATINSSTLGNGFWITIGRRSTSGLVTLTPGGGQTIDGSSSYVIDTDFESVSLTSMGASGWRSFGRTSVEPVGELPALNAQTGTTYTLVIGDKGQKVTMSNASANTLTVPSNASVPFPLLTRIEVTQGGAGQTSLAAAGGVSIFSFGSPTANLGWLKLVGQNAGAILTKTATNTWLLEGNITA